MGNKTGTRRQQILNLFLSQRAGLSIDDAAERTGISRTAAQQHFSVLEQLGLVTKAARNRTGGRPVQTYVLTDAGQNCFPKQYAWFSELLLQQLAKDLGENGLRELLERMGAGLAQTLAVDMSDQTFAERLDGLLAVMQRLGYEVSQEPDPQGRGTVITALNCVYHDVAQQNRVVCEFDRTLLADTLGCPVHQIECMAEGGQTCRFFLRP